MLAFTYNFVYVCVQGLAGEGRWGGGRRRRERRTGTGTYFIYPRQNFQYLQIKIITILFYKIAVWEPD